MAGERTDWGDKRNGLGQWIECSPSMHDTLGSKLSTSNGRHGGTGLESKREFRIAWLCSEIEARQGYLSHSLGRQQEEQSSRQIACLACTVPSKCPIHSSIRRMTKRIFLLAFPNVLCILVLHSQLTMRFTVLLWLWCLKSCTLFSINLFHALPVAGVN